MKPMLTFSIDNELFDIAFIAKSEEAEQEIRDKAAAQGRSLTEYFQNEGLMALICMEEAKEETQAQ